MEAQDSSLGGKLPLVVPCHAGGQSSLKAVLGCCVQFQGSDTMQLATLGMPRSIIFLRQHCCAGTNMCSSS